MKDERNPGVLNLITTKRNLGKQLSHLDVKIVEVRSVIISAIEELVQNYVVPAMRIGSLNSDSIYTFNLDEIAETEIHNLMLSLFESKMSGLDKPSDDALNEALISIGVRNLSEEKRNDFYTVWAGEKAIESISFLAKFLSNEQNMVQDSSRLKSQEEQIIKLLQMRLPESVKSYLRMILSPDLAIIK